MVGVGSKILILDNSGGRIGLCIKILRKFRHMHGNMGNILLLTIRKYRKAIKMINRKVRIGELNYAILVKTKKNLNRILGPTIRFNTNGAVLLTKEMKPLAKRIYGGIFFEIRFYGFFRIALMAQFLF